MVLLLGSGTRLPSTVDHHSITLTFRQLPSHLDMYGLCSYLYNLTLKKKLDGVNKIGINYERLLVGMKISDATNLVKTFESTQMLSTLVLIDDDLLRMLRTDMIRNNTVTHLDMPHNRISNHGARLLAKLLDKNSVLCTSMTSTARDKMTQERSPSSRLHLTQTLTINRIQRRRIHR